MGETTEGVTRADEFDVDAVVPDLVELDPELADLLDLSAPPPDPLPRTEPKPPIPRPVTASAPPPIASPPTVPLAFPPPPTLAEDGRRDDDLEIPEFVAQDTGEQDLVAERADELEPEADAPDQEPEPPRLPVVPVGELDGFASQLGADLGAAARPGDPETEAPAAPARTMAPTPAEVVGVAARTNELGFAPCVEPSPVADIAELLPAWRRHLVKALTVAVAAAVVAALLLTNPRRSDDNDERKATAQELAVETGDVDPDTSLVAEAAIPLVDVYASPDDRQPEMSVEHPTEIGGQLVFLVEEQRGEWLHVFLPTRPSGRTGWVRADQVRLSKHDYKVVVKLEEHRLDVFEGGKVTFSAAIAVGTRDTPPPGGTFYVKELLKPPNPDTVYGNYAFGLSGFSNALENFNGGEGVIGIHGTNDPSGIGRDVSAGCIRMTNDDMLELVGELPLGTPVEILP